MQTTLRTIFCSSCNGHIGISGGGTTATTTWSLFEAGETEFEVDEAGEEEDEERAEKRTSSVMDRPISAARWRTSVRPEMRKMKTQRAREVHARAEREEDSSITAMKRRTSETVGRGISRTRARGPRWERGEARGKLRSRSGRLPANRRTRRAVSSPARCAVPKEEEIPSPRHMYLAGHRSFSSENGETRPTGRIILSLEASPISSDEIRYRYNLL